MLLAASPPGAALAQSAVDGFNPGADGYVFALAVQADGKIVVGGYFTTLGGATRNYIGRLNPDGSLDASFNPGTNDPVNTLAVQADDGKIVVGGGFTTLGGATRNNIGLLNPDGSLDGSFNANANDLIFTLALQADGKILAGGYFTTLGGATRNYIGRISNDTPALQDLTVANEGAAITWHRFGASPEVWRVTFELSTDGTSYTSLGAGRRIPGGWQLSGLSLPSGKNFFVRARGFYTTGLFNGSSSVAISVRNFYLPSSQIYLPLVRR